MAQKHEPNWDEALGELLASDLAGQIGEERIKVECWNIAFDFLQKQHFVDVDTGASVADIPDGWMEQAAMFIATGIWLGMAGLDDLDFIKYGGHEIANRLRRLRGRLTDT